MTELASEITKILDKHKSRFLLDPLFPDEEFEKYRVERAREFHLMTEFLKSAMDECDAEELKERIADKLAYSSLQRIGRNDWWWSPASELVASTLREVQRTVEKTTKKTVWDRVRAFRWVWWVVRELIYLVIVVSMFAVASSKFETVVVAALVLIYSRVASIGSAIGMGVIFLASTAEAIYWEFGRMLRLKVPISRLTKAKKLVGDLSIPTVIHNISIGIGSLIALWHLVITLSG